MNNLEFLIEMRDKYHCMVRDRSNSTLEATNSFLIRLCKDGAVEINKKKVNWRDEVEFPIKSLVFFPNGKRRTTIK